MTIAELQLFKASHNGHIRRWFNCYSDEHYMPTLLAVKGLAEETDCLGMVTNVHFNRTGAHPQAYLPPDVNTEL